MMELLVAVLVMGVGVLGVTGLQLVSLQNNRDALLRGEAVQQAYDILDRIRVNQPSAAYDGVDMDDDPPGFQDCMAGACTTAEMVAYDIGSWKCSLGAHMDHATCTSMRDNGILPAQTAMPGLPDGDGSIAVNGVSITVTVQWRGFDDQMQTVTVNSQG